MFWKKLLQLCHEKRITPNKVSSDLGYSKSTATAWKKGSLPRPNTLYEIAEYFHVPVSYFEDNEIDILPQPNVYNIPVFESVSAGFGSYAASDVIAHIPLYINTPTEAKDYLCIKVKGDSMYPKIEDGDIVVVRKTDTAENGSIAVVTIDGDEGFIKRIEFDNTKVTLRPINPMYPPLSFEGGDVLRLRVIGQVTKIIKEV